MKRSDPIKALAGLRIAIGAGMLFAPRVVARLWLGRGAASAPGISLTLQSLGAREVVLGAGTAAAVVRRDDPGPWLLAAVVVDAADGVSSIVGRDELPPVNRLLLPALAFAAAATGAALVRRGG